MGAATSKEETVSCA